MKEYKYKINGNLYKVAVGDIDNNVAQVEVNGTPYTVELEKKEVSIKSEVIKEDKVELPSWVKEVEKVDPLNMSPLEALNYLYELKRKMKG